MEINDLKGILEGRVKLCIGLMGMRCTRMRRNGGRLCKECHTMYVRQWRKRKKRAGSGRERVIDGYDFNQERGQ